MMMNVNVPRPDTRNKSAAAAGLKRNLVRIAFSLAATVVVGSQLTACFPLAAAGLIGGGMAAADRRTLGAQTDDQSIQLRAASRISERFGDRVHVNVNSYNRKILLTGEVPDQATADEVARIAAKVENVLSIVNEVAISGLSSLTARSSDTFITGKVRATLIDDKETYASAFKVVTERGAVYLMGRVTQREGDRAANLTRGIAGVLKVVKVFDYISEDELKQMQAQPAPEGEKKAPSQRP